MAPRDTMRVALCPVHGTGMDLAIGGLTMEEWWCEACAENRTVVLDADADAPPGALFADEVRWTERDVDPRFGRIANEEGG